MSLLPYIQLPRNSLLGRIGKTLLLGALTAGFISAQYPVVTGISPSYGPATGGTPITITGTGFLSTTAIQTHQFFYQSGRGFFTVVNDTTITMLTPPGTGIEPFIVEGRNYGAGNNSTGYFTYVSGPLVSGVSPSSGPAAGGTSVTITGLGFTGATAITVGGVPVPNFIVVNDTTITATMPPGTPGSAGIIVTVAATSSASTTSFTYSSSVLQIYSLAPYGNMQVVQNESLFASSTASLFATQPGNSWTASTAAPWLSLTPSAGAFPGNISLTANTTGLTVGTYSATVTITSGALSTAFQAGLSVLPPASLTASPVTINTGANFPAGLASGWDIHIAPAGVAFTASASAYSSSWLSFSPATGTGPATMHVVIIRNAIPGEYQDSITITGPAGTPNSPLSIPVRLVVGSGIIPILEAQVGSATGGGADHTVAPNEIVSLFLSDFSCASQPVVAINGTDVPWSAWSPGQINYAVPFSFAAPGTLSVACNGITAWSFYGLNLANYMPGIFTLNQAGTGEAAAVNMDGTMNSGNNGASRGTVISLYGSGFGLYNPAGTDGLKHLAGIVTAQVGGVPATIEYAGESSSGVTDSSRLIC